MTVLVVEGAAPLLEDAARMSWAPTSIDMSALRWVSPFDIVVLAVVWTRLQEEGRQPTVVLPKDRGVRAYLVDVGLADVIQADWNVEAASMVEPPLIRLTRLTAPEQWDDLVPTLLAPAQAALGDAETVRRTFYILSELIDNAATHGHSPAGAFVCAQRYTGRASGLEPGVWLGIADGGRGIPAHLRLNPRYEGIRRDEELIRIARRPWVTGTADRRGWGLVEVFEEAEASGPSEILIRSGRGEGYFRLHAGQRLRARYRTLRPAVPGAWVHLRVEGH